MAGAAPLSWPGPCGGLFPPCCIGITVCRPDGVGHILQCRKHTNDWLFRHALPLDGYAGS
eukprot:scaffold89321_cov48-Attheya_sp.AAC.1